MSETTFMKHLLKVAGQMSRAERRVARALFETNLEAGLKTVANLATCAGVSGPTVLRFASSLGFDSYAAFQAALKPEFEQRVTSPTALHSQQTSRFDVCGSLESVAEECCNNIRRSFAAIGLKDLKRIIALLANEQRPFYTVGGSFSNVFAELLAARLYQLRPNVRVIGSSSISLRIEEELPLLGRKDVLLVLDLRRYEKRTIDFARAEDLKRIIAILANEQRSFYALGGSFSNVFAELLVARLYQLRPNVRVIGSSSISLRIEEELPLLGRKDVLLVLDLRRYEKRTIDFAHTAHERGTTIILVTDPWLSPIADFAHSVITSDLQATWSYDCYVSCTAIIELLVACVLSERGDAAWERIEMLEGFQPGLLEAPWTRREQ